MIKLIDGERITLFPTETIVLAYFNVLPPDHQGQVADGLFGLGVTADPKQLCLTLDGVMMNIIGTLPVERRRVAIDWLMAIREQIPVPQLVVRRIATPGMI